jgi:hypothetical protein
MSVFITGTILQPKEEADMRISQTAQKIKSNQVMEISMDLHKDSLNFFFEAGGDDRNSLVIRKESSASQSVTWAGSSRHRLGDVVEN